MPLFNILEEIIKIETFHYIIYSFVFLGLNLAVKKLIKGRNPL